MNEITDSSEQKLTARILALFETRKEMNAAEIVDLFPDENPSSVKNALFRLRGKGGVKRLRVKGYLDIKGRNGFEVAILELGNAPDVVKSASTIQVDDEQLRRAAKVRSQREELRFRREMAALDW
jgi:hypothetical protein